MAEIKGIRSFKKPLSQKASVVQLVVERIKQALLKRELMPGDYLPSETELTKSLGISKSSVREAIKMLQAMGIVEVLRGQGTIISKQPSPDYINALLFQLIIEDSNPRHIVDLRIMFETACSVMAMDQATEDDIATIQQTITGLEKSWLCSHLPTGQVAFCRKQLCQFFFINTYIRSRTDCPCLHSRAGYNQNYYKIYGFYVCFYQDFFSFSLNQL